MVTRARRKLLFGKDAKRAWLHMNPYKEGKSGKTVTIKIGITKGY